jgi:hypothetical protein
MIPKVKNQRATTSFIDRVSPARYTSTYIGIEAPEHFVIVWKNNGIEKR